MGSLDEMVDILRKLGDTAEIRKRVATKAAPKVEAALTATLSAGQTPDGVTWAPTKKSGARAYANAASKLNVYANGNIVSARLVGPEFYAQRGLRGIAQRQMLPEGSTPKPIADALNEAAREVWEEATK